MKAKIYYGMHMEPGVAEYNEGGKMFRVLAREEVCKKMDPTFPGCPVYVLHVDGVPDNREEIKQEADGYVAESFYNPVDGKHWTKFIVNTDEGVNAIEKGWVLSNAYFAEYGPGGLWHAVEYHREVISGEYEHLAIVPNPRYEGSVILTPEEFKEYNSKKEKQLQSLKNSNNNKKGEEPMKLTFFKREKVENGLDLESTMVALPKSKREVTIAALVNEADASEMAKKENEGKPVFANGEHRVKIGDGDMSVNELVEKYNSLIAKPNAEEEIEEDDGAEVENESDEEEVENAGDEEPKEEPKKTEAKKNSMTKTPKSKEHFNALKNAHKNAVEEVTIETSDDMVARGKSRYGSK
ncbi:hypothetical protein phi1422_0048 [Bdellovibrio phage phi1422]|uniref:hypothetical protein n=1 Tax=Bdellovibrio phage phi1422 TaxID=1127515 RepID=UPI0002536D64|nr:hypothetical protein F395_gp48 [Bdellovibrio phage phi1422]AFC22568.1 hypothetical protein phi1422_0048 [Bdellovibrio phage phi1422]